MGGERGGFGDRGGRASTGPVGRKGGYASPQRGPAPAANAGVSDPGAEGNPVLQDAMRRKRRQGLFAAAPKSANPTTPTTGGGPGSPILG